MQTITPEHIFELFKLVKNIYPFFWQFKIMLFCKVFLFCFLIIDILLESRNSIVKFLTFELILWRFKLNLFPVNLWFQIFNFTYYFI